MAQFDVHRIGPEAYVIDCQSDSFDHLTTRVVAPLMPSGGVPTPLSRLHPILTMDGQIFVFAAHLLTAMPCRDLGPPVASLGQEEYAIKNALDMLLTGV